MKALHTKESFLVEILVPVPMLLFMDTGMYSQKKSINLCVNSNFSVPPIRKIPQFEFLVWNNTNEINISWCFGR
jgi:hypothetical protein